MDTIVDSITGQSGPGGNEVRIITLPDDLRDWATRHEPMISRLSQSFTVKSEPLTEGAVWEMIAGNFSPEWTNARATLKAAERHIAHLMSPENMPLGLIGGALHSDETNAASKQHAFALADFTIVNETLRQQDELHGLLGVLLNYQHTLGKSLDLSHSIAGITDAFGDVATMTPEATPEAAKDFGKASRQTKQRKPEPDGELSLSFRQIAARLLGRPAATAVAKVAKAPAPTGGK